MDVFKKIHWESLVPPVSTQLCVEQTTCETLRTPNQSVAKDLRQPFMTHRVKQEMI
jgi:hypothetical protein